MGTWDSNVSEPLTELIGRDAALERAQELLAEGTRWLTVSGPVGVGKSRLLAALAASVTPSEAPGGIWVSSLSGAEGEATVCARIAASLPNVDALALPQSGDALGAALHGRDAILVLDDAEHAVPVLSRWLPLWLARTPRLRCLVGTRERLGGAGEVVLRLEPLEATDAEQLFERRAEHARGEPLRPEERSLVGRIAELLDRLPLALEMAAAQLAALGASDLLASLREHSLRLASPDRAADARHESLEAALDLSWELLDEGGREALAVLALFESAPDLADFRAVLASEGAPTMLAALRDRSWLQIDADPGGHRYRLLRVVRAYVRERAASDAGRVARYVAHVEARASELLRTWGDRESTLALGRLAPDVNAAMDAAPDGSVAMKLGVVSAQVALARGPVPETLERIDAVLREDEGASATLVDALLLRGRLRARVARPEESHRDYERALALAEELGDAGRTAHAATSLADHWRHHGDSARSEAFYRQALESATDLAQRARVTASLAGLSAERGDLNDAEALYQRAVAGSRAAEDVLGEAAALQNLALLLQERGELDRAEALTRQALELHLPLGQRRFEAIAHLDLAALALQRSRPLDARREAQAAVRLAAEAGDQRERALAKMLLGVALATLDELELAEVAFARASDLAEPLSEPGLSSALAIHLEHLALARARAGAAVEVDRQRPAEGDDARMARRVLTMALERAERASTEARVALDGSRVLLPGGESLDLSGRSVLSGIVAALAAALRSDPGGHVSAGELVAAGWPGSRSVTKAAMNRLHVALATLRKLGMAAHLERQDDGYRLVACRIDVPRD